MKYEKDVMSNRSNPKRNIIFFHAYTLKVFSNNLNSRSYGFIQKENHSLQEGAAVLTPPSHH